MGIKQLPYKIQEEEWIKGGFRIVLELQEHLSQRDRDTLGESISIEDINKAGDDISGKPIQ